MWRMEVRRLRVSAKLRDAISGGCDRLPRHLAGCTSLPGHLKLLQ